MRVRASLAAPIRLRRPSGELAAPGDLLAHDAVVYDQKGAGTAWSFRCGDTELAVTLKGRLRVTAAEDVRAAVLADAGIAVVSEWMFTPEIADGRVKAVLRDWELPAIDLWAVFPAGRTASTKARTFTAFVEDVMHARPARPGRAGVSPGR